MQKYFYDKSEKSVFDEINFNYLFPPPSFNANK